MKGLESVQEFFTTQIVQASIWEFILNLILAAILASIVRRVYVRYGNSLSNRQAFSNNFVLLAVTTMLIITIVRSSLALSLGLIGALSIVRFRAAIKEPEELSYLFLIIAIGLGFGANQRFITVVAVITILSILFLKEKRSRNEVNWEQSLYLNVTSHFPETISLDNVIDILKENCSMYRMKRFDKTDSLMEACLLVEFVNENSLQQIESRLREIDSAIKISYLDYKGGGLGGSL